jgi:putative endonuclease
MEYFTYIIRSQIDGIFYIGSSADPLKRLEKHNAPHKGFTGKKQPWELVYTEKFDNKTAALIRENFMKKQKNRKFILALIESKNGQ